MPNEFYRGKPPIVMIIHRAPGGDVTYIDEAGNRYTNDPEEFRELYEATDTPEDSEYWYDLKERTLEEATKEISAPEVAGDATAPEADVTVPEEGSE